MSQTDSTAKLSKRKLWFFRALAVLLGLSPLILLELVLMLLGWQPTNSIEDPYIGFSSIRPLFVPSTDGAQWVTAENRKPLFREDSFRKQKSDSGFRIFCIGGSTVQGRPFAIETAFSSWLEIGLKTADPDRDYEVVNCGGVSYASYRLVPIVEEVLQHQPDLIILYTGHNEFLEDRTYGSVKQLPQLLTDTHGMLSQLRSYRWIRRWVVAAPKADSADSTQSLFEMPTEVDARLDFAGGLAMYHRDEAWKLKVMQHFELNLIRMIHACQQKNVPLVMVRPVSNIRDSAPFKSELDEQLDPIQRNRFEQLVRATERSSVSTTAELESDRQLLTQAIEIDSKHAMAQFKLGQTLIQLNQIESARIHLMKAKEEDICPLRILEPMQESITNLTQQYSIPLVDANHLFQNLSPDGLVGMESLVDHVHPSIAGHQKLGRAVFQRLAEERLIPIPQSSINAQFDARLADAFEKHLANLPYLYFERGKDRLEGLRRWAAGEVRMQRPSSAAIRTSDPHASQ